MRARSAPEIPAAPAGNRRARAPVARRVHRALGLAFLVPILLWAATGLAFHVKPGWAAAYAPLELPLEPLGAALEMPAERGWLEARRLRTTLGEHLLVRTAEGWQHLDARTLEPFPEPSEAELRALVERAVASDPERYGRIAAREGRDFVTTTGARVELDWSTLSLAQRGRDTALIDALYRVHYLQWTGIPAVDGALALAGLAGLVTLALLGLRLARGR